MDERQVIEIIKQNPQMSYEEIKRQALGAGVSDEIFEKAYSQTRVKDGKLQTNLIVYLATCLGVIMGALSLISIDFLFLNPIAGALSFYYSFDNLEQAASIFLFLNPICFFIYGYIIKTRNSFGGRIVSIMLILLANFLAVLVIIAAAMGLGTM